MADDKKTLADLGTGIQSILDRVGEFFHIFDLAFFVAGTSTLGAFTFLYFMMGMGKRITFSIAPWMTVVAVIVCSYICGLITFAVGRCVSSRFFRRSMLEKKMPNIIKAHGLTDPSIQSYDPVLLYARMWSEVAQGRLGKPVLQHLSRYWAMAATYDAVAVSLVVWAGVFFLVQCNAVAPKPLGTLTGWGMAGACLFSAYMAFQRGMRYFEYQIEDIVANFAAFLSPLTAVDRPSHNPAVKQ